MNRHIPCELQMPKACVSCTHYTAEGFDNDAHCPFTHWGRPKTRTPYGKCSQHKQEVFATEICGSYQCERGVASYPVPNRPQPRQPLQEQLWLQGGTA
ncbi:hypothetical protein [Halopseudomonas laoshanensis]|uniref:hypothetical protein n=1 Tax=Halopseudomonas laoshanensis TaxID=2268758 RepID=UPI003735ACF2